MKIIIYARNITRLDGVGNSVRYFNSVLKKNYDVLLVAFHSDIEGVIKFDDYLKIHSDSNILIYHFSIFDLNQERLLNLNFNSRILYYHGITDPILFESNNNISIECSKGLDQIEKLCDFDLYFANSSYSKNQFKKRLINNGEINFFIMPPLNILENLENFYMKNEADFDNIQYYYLGSLGNHKNVFKLCDLFCMNDKSSLSILTSNSEDDMLNMIEKSRYGKYLKNNITFYHRLDDENKNIIIKEKNAFITFSSHEGFCIPLFEAVFLNKPIIVKKLECFSDYMPEDYHFLNEKINYDSIVDTYFLNYKKIEYTRNYVIYRYKNFFRESWKNIYELLSI